MSKSVSTTNLPAKRKTAARAKIGNDKVVVTLRQGCRSISSILLKLRNIFPAKTALEIALRTDCAPRTAQRWLAGEAEISAAALADLLRSDIGRALLMELMRGSDAPWWRDFNRQLELAALARAQADLQRSADVNREQLLRAMAGEGGAL